jgi:hypothetical protein
MKRFKNRPSHAELKRFLRTHKIGGGASEATIVASLQFAKGNIGTVVMASGSVARDVAGSVYTRNVQDVGFAAREAMLLGDAGTGGYCLMHNADATNFVDVFPDAAGTDPVLMRLKAKDWALFRLQASAPYLKADTAAVKVEYFLLPA